MSNSHVLVVDDEADIRALIQDILSDEGYGVTVAADAEEARAARVDKNFDLICWISGCRIPTASPCCVNGPKAAT